MRFLPSKTDRKVFGKIAEEYDLVYFGRVDPRVDTDYKMVRGLTASPHVRDENYTTGNVYDYEVAFLQRSKKVHLKNNITADRKWTILQIQLKKANLPHVFIDNIANGSEYGGQLMAALRLPEIGGQNFAASPEFSKAFKVYAKPQSLQEIRDILTPEAQETLAAHFSKFDYELQQDKLIIYAGGDNVDLQLLDHMLRIGLWLARDVDRCAGKICEIRDDSEFSVVSP